MQGGLKHSYITSKGRGRDPSKAAPCSSCSPPELTVDRHKEHLARLSGGVGGDALEPPLVPGAGAGDEQRARGLHPAWAQHTLGTAPAPWGDNKRGKTQPRGKVGTCMHRAGGVGSEGGRPSPTGPGVQGSPIHHRQVKPAAGPAG